jgi:hypothetical protein
MSLLTLLGALQRPSRHGLDGIGPHQTGQFLNTDRNG